MNLPFVSIVIPAYNEEAKIDDCINSLLNLDYPKDLFEIIIVNNGSTDKTEEIVIRYKSIRYFYLPKANVFEARNKGFSVANGELIASTDADIIVEPDWLIHLIAAFENEEIGAAYGVIMAGFFQNNWVERIDCEIRNPKFEFSKMLLPPASEFLPHFSTGNVMLRKNVFKQVGEFDLPDTASVGFEDMDLSWRITLAGYKLRRAPDAIVYHRNLSSIKELLFKMALSIKHWEQFTYLYRNLFGKKNYAFENPITLLIKSVGEIFCYLIGNFTGKDEYQKQKHIYTAAHYCGSALGRMAHFIWVMGHGERSFKKSKAKQAIESYKRSHPKPTWWFGLDGHVVLFDGNKAYLKVLNETATFIWLKLVEGLELSSIENELLKIFGCSPEKLKKDMDAFLNELHSNDFLKNNIPVKSFYYEPDVLKAIKCKLYGPSYIEELVIP